MALVELARFYNSFEAGAVQSFLTSERIDTVIFDINMSWEGLSGVIPIRLMVEEADLDRARRTLADFPER